MVERFNHSVRDIQADAKITRAWERLSENFEKETVRGFLTLVYEAEIERYHGEGNLPQDRVDLSLLKRSQERSFRGRQAAREYFIWLSKEYADFVKLLVEGQYEEVSIRNFNSRPMPKPDMEELINRSQLAEQAVSYIA